MSVLPVVGAPRPLRPPRIAEAKLPNGLRVLVVRKTTVPRVEIRLVSPVGGTRDIATARVHPKTLLSGTRKRSSTQIAQDIQRFGATFGTAVSSDHFQLSGSVLAVNLRPFLELVTEILREPAFPADEVALERARVVQEIEMSRSQAQVRATEALRRRMFGRHPYGTVLPEPKAVARVGPSALERLHSNGVGPRGGVLVVVGDVQPQAALALVAETVGRWRNRVAAQVVTRPSPPKAGAALFVDRPGSVQTCIKMAGAVPALGSDDSYAVDVANTIFGGYFISRWVDNLRERNGYTYSPHSALVHQKLADHVEISADVGADVTAPAIVETHYELGRMAALEVTGEELESAKRYRTGIQSLRVQSQSGLASVLAGIVTFGLGIDYLREYPKRIAAVTALDVREAAAAYLAPHRLVTVLVGDATRVARTIEPLTDLEVATS